MFMYPFNAVLNVCVCARVLGGLQIKTVVGVLQGNGRLSPLKGPKCSRPLHSARQQLSGCANGAIRCAGEPGKPAYQEAGCTERWVGLVVSGGGSARGALCGVEWRTNPPVWNPCSCYGRRVTGGWCSPHDPPLCSRSHSQRVDVNIWEALLTTSGY